jgi:sugar O-acyltransferase (sialic acid O-acetyltransferase NeuD family)
MRRQVVIIGAGGFAREAAETVRAISSQDGSVELLGFLDDDPALQGRELAGTAVLGKVEDLADHPGAGVVIAVGRPDAYTTRRAIAVRLRLDLERYVTLVHPSASIGASCSIGSGTVVLAHVAMTADASVGHHVAVMPQVVLPHDVRVDDYATLASGVRLGGGVHVGEGAYVASGACVREGCHVGSWSMVGMGSTVIRDVPDERLWFGSPARDVRRAPLPWPAADPASPSSPAPEEANR